MQPNDVTFSVKVTTYSSDQVVSACNHDASVGGTSSGVDRPVLPHHLIALREDLTISYGVVKPRFSSNDNVWLLLVKTDRQFSSLIFDALEVDDKNFSLCVAVIVGGRPSFVW